MIFFVDINYTIKRINKGLKLTKTLKFKNLNYTMKRINKGLKPQSMRYYVANAQEFILKHCYDEV